MCLPHLAGFRCGQACLLPMSAAITPCPTAGACSSGQCLLNVCIPPPDAYGAARGIYCGKLQCHVTALCPPAVPVVFHVVQQQSLRLPRVARMPASLAKLLLVGRWCFCAMFKRCLHKQCDGGWSVCMGTSKEHTPAERQV
jgi:hypothetical protein